MGWLDAAREKVVNEATRVSYLVNDGGSYAAPLTGALERSGANRVVERIGVHTVFELMLAEAASIEDRARLDPNRPQPEPRLERAMGGGSKSWSK